MTNPNQPTDRNGAQLPPGEVSAANYVGDPTAGEFIDWDTTFMEKGIAPPTAAPKGGEPTYFRGERTIFGTTTEEKLGKAAPSASGMGGGHQPGITGANPYQGAPQPQQPQLQAGMPDPRGSMPFAGQLAPLMATMHGKPAPDDVPPAKMAAHPPWIAWGSEAPMAAAMTTESAPEGRGYGQPNFDAEKRGEDEAAKSLRDLNEYVALFKARRPKKPKAGSGQMGFSFEAPTPAHKDATHTKPPKKAAAGAWGPIPGGAKNGQRRKVGGKWQYRYPDGKGGWSSRPKKEKKGPSKAQLREAAGRIVADLHREGRAITAAALIAEGVPREIADEAAAAWWQAEATRERAAAQKRAAAIAERDRQREAARQAREADEAAARAADTAKVDAARESLLDSIARFGGSVDVSGAFEREAAEALVDAGDLRGTYNADGVLTYVDAASQEIWARVDAAAMETALRERKRGRGESAMKRKLREYGFDSATISRTVRELRKQALEEKMAEAAEPQLSDLAKQVLDRLPPSLAQDPEVRRLVAERAGNLSEGELDVLDAIGGEPLPEGAEAAKRADVQALLAAGLLEERGGFLHPSIAAQTLAALQPEPEDNFETMPEAEADPLAGVTRGPDREETMPDAPAESGSANPDVVKPAPGTLRGKFPSAVVPEALRMLEAGLPPTEVEAAIRAAGAGQSASARSPITGSEDRFIHDIMKAAKEEHRIRAARGKEALQVVRDLAAELGAAPKGHHEHDRLKAMLQHYRDAYVAEGNLAEAKYYVRELGNIARDIGKFAAGSQTYHLAMRAIASSGREIFEAFKAKVGEKAPAPSAEEIVKEASKELGSEQVSESNFETMPESEGGKVEEPREPRGGAAASVSRGMRPKPTSPKGTPRGDAERARSAETGYINDRTSAVAQTGTDTWGSARERALRWQGVDRAIAAGSEASFRFKKLDAAEGPNLSESLDPNEGDDALVRAAFNALAYRKFPAKPKVKDKRVYIAVGRAREGFDIGGMSDPSALRGYYRAFEAWAELFEKADAAGRAVTYRDIEALHDTFEQEYRRRAGWVSPTNYAEATTRPPATTMEEAAAMRDAQVEDRVAAETIRAAYNAVGGVGKTAPRKLRDDFRKRLEATREADDSAAARQQLVEAMQSVARGEGSYKKLVEGHKFDRTRRRSFDIRKAYDYGLVRRQGGDEAPKSADAAVSKLTKGFGLANVQWGKSVTDEEREHHAKESAAALSDLASVLGLPEERVSMNGKLALAIGARGKGAAMAHYEPGLRIINLTRKNGVGTLAHEWGHWLDYVGGTADSGPENSEPAAKVARLTEQLRALPADTSEKDRELLELKISAAASDAAAAANRTRFTSPKSVARARETGASSTIRNAVSRLVSSGVWEAVATQTEAFVEREGGNPDYWLSNEEMFARCFEAHVQHKLKEDGRENTYLVSLRNLMRGGAWPTWRQSAAMAPMFDAILAEYAANDALFKAMYGVGTRDRSSGKKGIKMTMQKGGMPDFIQQKIDAKKAKKKKKDSDEEPKAKKSLQGQPLVDFDVAGRPLRKGLHAFDGSREVTLPDSYLYDYLCAFVHEAYEHEIGEAAHQPMEAKDQLQMVAKAIFGELLQYAVKNSNLMRAITQHPQSAKTIGAILVRDGVHRPQADSDWTSDDMQSHVAMGLEPMAYSMTVRDVQQDILAHTGTALVDRTPENAAHLVKGDEGTALDALRGARARNMRELWGLADDDAGAPTVDAACPIHGGADISKAHMVWHGMLPCTCPKH